MIIEPILDTSFIHFSLKGWENVLFELGSERVKTVAALLQLELERRFGFVFLIKGVHAVCSGNAI